MRRILLIVLLGLVACENVKESSQSHDLLNLGEDVWTTLSSGNNNNVDLGSGHGYYSLTPDAGGSTVTGFDASTALAGDSFYIRNSSTTIPITLAHMSTASEEINRLNMPYGHDYTLEPGRSVLIEFLTHEGATVGWTIWSNSSIYDVTSTSAPSHTLGSAWQNTTNRPVLGLYSVRISSALNIVGGQAGRIELATGTSSGSQTTVCGRVAGGNSAVLAAGADMVEGQLSCIISPGSWAILRSTNEVSTPTYTITNQLEQAL